MEAAEIRRQPTQRRLNTTQHPRVVAQSLKDRVHRNTLLRNPLMGLRKMTLTLRRRTPFTQPHPADETGNSKLRERGGKGAWVHVAFLLALVCFSACVWFEQMASAVPKRLLRMMGDLSEGDSRDDHQVDVPRHGGVRTGAVCRDAHGLLGWNVDCAVPH
jgi:hypothetical protein